MQRAFLAVLVLVVVGFVWADAAAARTDGSTRSSLNTVVDHGASPENLNIGAKSPGHGHEREPLIRHRRQREDSYEDPEGGDYENREGEGDEQPEEGEQTEDNGEEGGEGGEEYYYEEGENGENENENQAERQTTPAAVENAREPEEITRSEPEPSPGRNDADEAGEDERPDETEERGEENVEEEKNEREPAVRPESEVTAEETESPATPDETPPDSTENREGEVEEREETGDGEEASREREERPESREIIESGREDLERYKSPDTGAASASAENPPEEDQERNEDEDEIGETTPQPEEIPTEEPETPSSYEEERTEEEVEGIETEAPPTEPPNPEPDNTEQEPPASAEEEEEPERVPATVSPPVKERERSESEQEPSREEEVEEDREEEEEDDRRNEPEPVYEPTTTTTPRPAPTQAPEQPEEEEEEEERYEETSDEDGSYEPTRAPVPSTYRPPPPVSIERENVDSREPRPEASSENEINSGEDLDRPDSMERLEEERRRLEMERLEEERRERERERLEEDRRFQEQQRLEQERRQKEIMEEERRQKERERIEEIRRAKERQRMEKERQERERIRMEEERIQIERERLENERRRMEMVRQAEEERQRQRERQEEERKLQEERERMRQEEERKRMEESSRQEEDEDNEISEELSQEYGRYPTATQDPRLYYATVPVPTAPTTLPPPPPTVAILTIPPRPEEESEEGSLEPSAEISGETERQAVPTTPPPPPLVETEPTTRRPVTSPPSEELSIEVETSDELIDNEIPVTTVQPDEGYTITCEQGYELSDDKSACIDIDECARNVCGPQQTCTNLEGSYKCTCPLGYIKDYRNEKNCRDHNECEENNGGCSQDCINTQGSFQCLCDDEHILQEDGKSCRPRPTTNTTTTTTTTTTTPAPVTEPPAINIPSRPNGFGKPQVPSGSATDAGVKGCPTPPVPRAVGIAYLYCSRSQVGIHHRQSHLHKKLLESFAQKKNKTLAARGNAIRYRRHGAKKRVRKQTHYSPGSTCVLRCRPGFELVGTYTLNCNSTTGIWEGTTTGQCRRRPAFPTRRPYPIRPTYPTPTPSTTTTSTTTTTTTPAPTTTTTLPTYRPTSRYTRPTFYDYRPLPASNYTSTNTVINRRPTRPPTVHPYTTDYRHRPATFAPPPVSAGAGKIHVSYRYKTPWITCPDDMKVDVPSGQSLTYISIPQPQTNVDWWRQVTAQPSWAKGLESELGPGKYRITFMARTAATMNNTAECSFTLEVRDSDPPRVQECPESFNTRLTHGQSAKAVTWVEPHFSDNVRVASVKKSHEPGTILSAGEHLITYEAKDESGNSARCSFTVTIFPAIPSPATTASYRAQPINTEGGAYTSSAPRTDVHSKIRNVVCYIGEKGRRIVFQSRVIPRGCSEMTIELGDSSNPGTVDGSNTVTHNSSENSATSQISSVSFSTHENPRSAAAFSQAIASGRNANRIVHSSTSVTNSGSVSRASSYAVAIASSSNVGHYGLNPSFGLNRHDGEEEDFVIPTAQTRTRHRSGGQWHHIGRRRYSQARLRDEVDTHAALTRGTLEYSSLPKTAHATLVRSHPNPTISFPQHEIETPGVTEIKSTQGEPSNTPRQRNLFRHLDSWDKEQNQAVL